MNTTTATPRSRAGHIATFVLGVLALGGAVAALSAALPSVAMRTSPLLVQPATPAELAGALVRAGLTPEHLAAAGVDGTRARAVYAAAEAHLEEHIGTLRGADADLAEARAEHDRLLRLVQSGTGSPEDVTALASARTTLAGAQSAADAANAGLFAAATEGLSGGEVAAVQTARTNAGAGRALATRYLLQERTEAQWRRLRDALANRRIAAARGEEPDQGAAGTCLDADADSATAAANLQANLAGVQAAWEAATGM